MKKVSVYFSVLLGLIVFVSSCKKDEDDDHGNNATITVSAPLEGGSYNHADTVFVNAVIAADEAMHGWEIHLRNKADQTELFSKDLHDHAATYTIAEYWVNSVAVDTDMELEIIAEIDHDGNTISKKVNFYCHQ